MPTLKPTMNTGMGRGCALVFCIGWLGFCIFWCITALKVGSPFMMLCTIPHLIFGIGLLCWIAKPTVLALKVGPPEVEVSGSPLHPGETFRFRFQQPVRQSIAVDKISLRFLFRESATYVQGTTTRTDKDDRVLWEWEQPVASFGAGQSILLEHVLEVPAGAMHTFAAAHNKLQYLVTVHVAIAGWPDFQEEYEVQVVPEGTA